MATYQHPGVYVQETLNPLAPVLGASSNTVAAFFGASDRGPTSPVLLTSWSQYVQVFGGWNTTQSNALPLGVYMYFQNGGNQAQVCRVAGTGAVVATKTLQDTEGTPASTLRVSAANAGAWGNNINISTTASTIAGYFNLIVYYGGTTASNIVEQWLNLNMTPTDPRYALSIISNNSNYISVFDLGSTATGATRNPAVVANQALSTGADGSAVTGANIVTQLAQLDSIQQSLVLNIPGYTDATTVNGAISYATGSTRQNDVFVVIDGVNDTVANQLTLASSYTATSYAAVYYPQVVISDPTQTSASVNSILQVGAGGAVAGIYAATDTSRGVFKAPAGLQTRIAGTVGVAASLTMANLDSLNSSSAPVNAIRYIPGSGVVVMGARTLQPGFSTRYVPVRRTLIYLEKALRDLTQFAIFEPNDTRLWARINGVVSNFLTSFWRQGGLSGTTPGAAFFVKCDSDINTPTSISNGFVNIQVGVALQNPAEFIIINIGQFDGGATVTVA